MIQPPERPPILTQRVRKAACALRLHGALSLALLVGCGARRASETIPRRLGGEAEPGAFVPPFAYEAYVRGELELLRGRPAQAVAHFELATSAPTEDAYLLSRLAFAQAAAGQREAAEETLRHAESVDDCAEALWLTRAEFALRDGAYDRAHAAYARAMACAPNSPRGVLGLARLLSDRGDSLHARTLLERFLAAHPRSEAVAQAALELALQTDSAASVAHALESWLGTSAPPSEALVRATEWALSHDRPELALRLYEHDRTASKPELEARIHMARGDREKVRAVLTRADALSLGGPLRAAEYALFAGDYERAELEATALLIANDADDGRVLRAQARAFSGDHTGALEDLEAVRDAKVRAELTLTLLELAGAPELAKELAAQATKARAAP